MDVTFTKEKDLTGEAVVVCVFSEEKLSEKAQLFDDVMDGALKKAINNSRFSGKEKTHLVVPAPTSIEASRIILFGIGEREEKNPLELEEMGGALYKILAQHNDEKATLFMPEDGCPIGPAHMMCGALLRSWVFDKYKTQVKPKDKISFKKMTVVTDKADEAKIAFEPMKALAEGVFLTRLLASEPANVLYPETMVEHAKELKTLGVKVEVLDEKDMKKLGMGALLGVGAGSEKESKLIVLQWHGGDKSQDPVAIVGKGVTFDTGGISIKPAGGMEEMKWDMAGSAVVMGLMKTLALRKAAVNVIGVMGMAENMPSGSAQRPGDIVSSMSGQTIEILNTDAEGRLVLADALWYTQNRFKPQVMIDLATLTGAVIVCLGHEKAGLFSNTEELAARLEGAGKATGDPLWRLPLSKKGCGYDKDIDTPAADMKNTGSGRGAGSTTAAQFLQRFVNDVPWAHLDIAGVAWEGKKDRPLSKRGATGFGVRLLNHFIKEHYEGA